MRRTHVSYSFALLWLLSSLYARSAPHDQIPSLPARNGCRRMPVSSEMQNPDSWFVRQREVIVFRRRCAQDPVEVQLSSRERFAQTDVKRDLRVVYVFRQLGVFSEFIFHHESVMPIQTFAAVIRK